MFEKELEEYKNQPKWKGKIFMKDEETCFKDGLEFGYNKANEWHYVKEGDLPKDNDEKLCFYEKGKVVARYDSEYNCWEISVNGFATLIPLGVIIAWKEIVLPELPKGGIEND